MHCPSFIPSHPTLPPHHASTHRPTTQAAVAAGQADLGLGTDTGGSARVPASYCGLWALRATHGRVPMEGVRALAASFSTVGLLARDAALLRDAGRALLGCGSGGSSSSSSSSSSSGGSSTQGRLRLVVLADAFDLALPDARAALEAALAAPAVAAVLGAPALEARLPPIDDDGGSSSSSSSSGGSGLALDSWLEAFRVIQAFETWAAYGGWLRATDAALGPGVRERFEAASRVTAAERDAAATRRERARAALAALLEDGGSSTTVLALPSAPGPAPEIGLAAARLDDWRKRVMQMTCIAGLGGLPQLSMPLARVGGLPVGLSLIGPAGSDELLLELGASIGAAAKGQ